MKGRWFEPRSCQVKDWKIGTCCFPGKRSPLKAQCRSGLPSVSLKWLGGYQCLSAAWYFGVLAI